MYGSSTADLFMEIIDANGSPINGESTDSEYAEQIEIDSFTVSGPDFDPNGTGGLSKKKGRKGKRKKGPTDRDVTQLLNMQDSRRQRQELDGMLSNAGNEDDDEDDDDAFENYSFVVKKDYDSSSPILLQSYCDNLFPKDGDMDKVKFERVTIRCRVETSAEDDVIVMQMDFADAYLIKYEMSVDDEESIPTETLVFKFARCFMTYTPQTRTGDPGEPKMTGWDFEKQEEWNGPS